MTNPGVYCPAPGGAVKSVALVQNQSEMANYSHADCRALLKTLGYTHSLFTANSIASLDDRLIAGEFDCLLLASNALHDKVIRQFFDSDAGRQAVAQFQRAGGGLVVLMQYKAAYEGYNFDFVLPEAVGLSAKQRPKTESAVTSKLEALQRESAPPLLSYPNNIELGALQRDSLDHATLPGVYWHWWDADLTSTWNAHLICTTTGEPRPLLISAQEHFGHRAVLSSLPIDWHAHQQLFHNIMLYGCEGRHHAAALMAGNGTREPSLEYLIAKLNARKIGLREYLVDRTTSKQIYDNIVNGVHNTLLLEPLVELDALFGPEQADVLRQRVERGSLRTISFKPSSKPWETSVQIRGRRNPAEDAYQMLIPRISQELLNGYLDGSFRSTVSGLQDLEHLPYGLDLGVFPVRASLAEAEKHERDGSYDEVIGATAGFLWLRAKVLGNKHADTLKTVEWLRARLGRVDARERIYALCVLEEVGLCTPEDIEQAKATLGQLTAIDASELELLAFLTGAVRFNQEQVMLAVLAEFARRNASRVDLWVDTPTTANLVRLLVDAHGKFASLRSAQSTSGAMLRDLVIPAMIAIEVDYERSLGRVAQKDYPWDGKASTALRCLSAWYRFEQYLGAPVDEAAGAVVRASQGATLSAFAGGAVGSLRTLFNAYDKLKTELATQTAEVDRLIGTELDLKALQVRLTNALRAATIAFALLFVLAYFNADYLVRRFVLDQSYSELSWMKNWAQHGAVLAAVLAALAVPWSAVGKFIMGLIDRKEAGHE